MNPRITVVGSLNMDLVVRSPRIPRPGETIIGHTFQTAPGGKGANQAVAAARLGGRVSMIGHVGQDTFGDQLLDSLAAADVDCRYIKPTSDTSTGIALIVVDDQGENSIVVASGANMSLTPQHLEEYDDVIVSADVLLLQLELPLKTVIRAAQIAKASGVTIILNPAPARELPSDLISGVDFLIPNETELALLTEMPVHDIPQVERAAHSLLERDLGCIIVTLGKDGALIGESNEFAYVSPHKISAADTTAAGDAFVGAFSVAYGEGKSIVEAVRWANAAGAFTATKLGAQPSLPSREELDNFIWRQARVGK